MDRDLSRAALKLNNIKYISLQTILNLSQSPCQTPHPRPGPGSKRQRTAPRRFPARPAVSACHVRPPAVSGAARRCPVRPGRPHTQRAAVTGQAASRRPRALSGTVKLV